MNVDISSIKLNGVIIYDDYLLVDNEVYRIKKEERKKKIRNILGKNKGTLETNDKCKREFEIALIFFVYADGEIETDYEVSDIPIGVVRKAKEIFRRKMEEVNEV